MEDKQTEKNVPYCNMIESGNYNCYEFYLAATERFGDYKQAQHMGRIVMRSEMIRDIEALAAYFSLELGLRRGDAYTIFLPTDIESIVGFYALNKLGVIVNFVHPLLPTEVLLETIRESRSRGIMILDLLSKDFLTHDRGRNHVEAINRAGLPVLLCHCSDYASPAKQFAAARAESLLKLPVRFKNAADYKKVLQRYRGYKVSGVKNNCGDVAVYLNGGGTTGKSKTIKLTNKAINENGEVKYVVAAPQNEAVDKETLAYGYLAEENLAELTGRWEIGAGADIVIRTAPGDKDISGIYGGEKLEEYTIENSRVEVYRYAENTVYAVWSCEDADTVFSHSVAVTSPDFDTIEVVKILVEDVEKNHPKG